MLDIQQKIIKYNFTKGRTGVDYIVIHDTGNTNAGADAEAHYNYFGGANRNASAHYFVDDHQIIQVIEDSNAAWHCGDGKGKYASRIATPLASKSASIRMETMIKRFQMQ